MPRPEHDLPVVLRPLLAVPVSRTTVPEVLATVADRAAAVLGVPTEVSVTVQRAGSARTVAASGPLARGLDELQYRGDAGPCLDAARRGVRASVVATGGTRWPELARALAAAGCDGLWSHPLAVEPPVTGSVNLYVREGLPSDEREVAEALAEHAAVPVANRWLYEEAVSRADNLQLALESRAVIEQAKGILMGRLKVTADQAFAALVRTSNDGNVKLRDVAQAVVDSGELPR